jgi:pimeloyl-ACP methyl ester carboxylesterase
MPDVDLDDPEEQRRLRQIAVPTDILTGLIECNRAARRACRPMPLPTLVVQGDHDRIARARYTRRLVQGLGRGVRYHEVDADHSLIYPDEPSWAEVERTVLAFADQVRRE